MGLEDLHLFVREVVVHEADVLVLLREPVRGLAPINGKGYAPAFAWKTSAGWLDQFLKVCGVALGNQREASMMSLTIASSAAAS